MARRIRSILGTLFVTSDDRVSNLLYFPSAFLVYVLLITANVQIPQISNFFEERVFDLYQVILPWRQDGGQVVIVDIEQTTVDELGSLPLSRAVLANAVSRIGRWGARAIGTQMVFVGFADVEGELDPDLVLNEALKAAPVVLAEQPTWEILIDSASAPRLVDNIVLEHENLKYYLYPLNYMARNAGYFAF